MPRLSDLKVRILSHVNPKMFKRSCVSCLILSKDNKIILQQRDNDCAAFPGCLAAFGGGIENNETPLQALCRELNEELGAQVKLRDVVNLGMLTEPETHHRVLVHLFFWHDTAGTITGCYEGEAKYYNSSMEAQNHPKIMEDVRWLLQECKKRKLLF